MSHTVRSKNYGFTIVELVVVVVVLEIMIVLFASVLVTGYKDTLRSKKQTELTASVQQAMDFVERDARYAKQYQTNISSPFSDSYGARNLGTAGAEAWTHKGVPANTTARALILQSYASSKRTISGTRQLVYTDGPIYDCSVSQKKYNPWLTHITIYFIRDQSLYRRILTDLTTPLCSGESFAQKQSCPDNIARASWAAGCQAQDEKIATNVTAFSVDYYANGSLVADAYSSSDPQVLKESDSIQVTLTSATSTGSVSSTSSLLIGRVNR